MVREQGAAVLGAGGGVTPGATSVTPTPGKTAQSFSHGGHLRPTRSEPAPYPPIYSNAEQDVDMTCAGNGTTGAATTGAGVSHHGGAAGDMRDAAMGPTGGVLFNRPAPPATVHPVGALVRCEACFGSCGWGERLVPSFFGRIGVGRTSRFRWRRITSMSFSLRCSATHERRNVVFLLFPQMMSYQHAVYQQVAQQHAVHQQTAQQQATHQQAMLQHAAQQKAAQEHAAAQQQAARDHAAAQQQAAQQHAAAQQQAAQQQAAQQQHALAQQKVAQQQRALEQGEHVAMSSRVSAASGGAASAYQARAESNRGPYGSNAMHQPVRGETALFDTENWDLPGRYKPQKIIGTGSYGTVYSRQMSQ